MPKNSSNTNFGSNMKTYIYQCTCFSYIITSSISARGLVMKLPFHSIVVCLVLLSLIPCKIARTSRKMLVASAAERNKQPILDVLQHYIAPTSRTGHILEIASGSGQHVAHFAPHFPHVTWQPSDVDPACLRSISAFIEGRQLKNVLQPLMIDITKPLEKWANQNMKPESHDVILNSNMVHISPWETSLGLFKTAGYLLKPNGVLFMYGPFKIDGILTPESNVSFDASLRSQNPTWGVRDISDLKHLAKQNGLTYEKMVDMPANNKCVIFRKVLKD